MIDKPGILRILLTIIGYALFTLLGWLLLLSGFIVLITPDSALTQWVSLSIEVFGGAILLTLHYLNWRKKIADYFSDRKKARYRKKY